MPLLSTFRSTLPARCRSFKNKTFRLAPFDVLPPTHLCNSPQVSLMILNSSDALCSHSQKMFSADLCRPRQDVCKSVALFLARCHLGVASLDTARGVETKVQKQEGKQRRRWYERAREVRCILGSKSKLCLKRKTYGRAEESNEKQEVADRQTKAKDETKSI